MKVYKFGGASIASPERAAALLQILEQAHEQLIIVVSALGKTTNELEQVVQQKWNGNSNNAVTLWQKIVDVHTSYARALIGEDAGREEVYEQIHAFADVIVDVLQETWTNYDALYDTIVSMGELLSTSILSVFLKHSGFEHVWVDARWVISTDDTFREANIDWETTEVNVGKMVSTAGTRHILTQGFIGATSSGQPVTLGREGSDYTAAVLAAITKADSVTIWKDVPGLLNADPKQFSDTTLIEKISFSEVIEMAFYGAQIIHPKTIKPLQNNDIPLHVKCFLDTSLPGTTICREVAEHYYPPLIVLKNDQVLLQVTTRDFSFITEENLSVLYNVFSKLRIKINLIQNAAISFIASVDNRPEKIEALAAELNASYKLIVNESVSLLTIRYYTKEKFESIVNGREILLRQDTRKTIQAVIR